MNKKQKRSYSIKGKLVSATCMLLVAMIMVVSSSYAWFTLSTAPEVKGITTAVGSNGALEMLLLSGTPGNWNYQDWTSGEGSATDKNTYWGNLVDVSDNTTYGLDKIILYPSQLNAMAGVDDLSDAIGSIIQTAPLLTPSYGADGRVQGMEQKTRYGAFKPEKGQFFPVEGDKIVYGVRAVGTASGLTPRQMAYSSAISAAATAAGQAKNVAAYSLNYEGAALADIAIKHGMASGGTDTYTVADINELLDIINSLLGTKPDEVDGALEYVEYAYKKYLVAYTASAAAGGDAVEELYATVEGWITEGKTLQQMIDSFGDAFGVTIPAERLEAMNKLIATIGEVTTAKNELQALIPAENPENASFTWNQIRPSLGRLCDTEKLTVNGYKVAEIKANTSAFASDVMEKGIQIQMATGAGVYADIADHCGDYSAVITIKQIEYSGTVLENQKANMKTKTDVTPTQYLAQFNAAVNTAGKPASSAAVEMPMSEFYGYVIDLAFRTNAAESNLLLQTDAVDRIYDSNNNAATMGGGSSMTFASASTDFDNDDVADLMSNIRIVFFDPTTNAIIAKAGLDVENATIGADGVTAKMYMLSETFVYEVTDATTGEVVVCTRSGDEGNYVYTKKNDASVTVTPKVDEAGKAMVVETKFLKGTDAVISALEQNTAKNVSVLVYLDGTTITNADVAATGASSMTGKMNLQFSSSANLVPMEYADLHIQEESNN